MAAARSYSGGVKKGKSSPYSITERTVPERIPVLGSQPAGDVSHKPGGRLPLLSARPAVTLTTLKIAATTVSNCKQLEFSYRFLLTRRANINVNFRSLLKPHVAYSSNLLETIVGCGSDPRKRLNLATMVDRAMCHCGRIFRRYRAVDY